MLQRLWFNFRDHEPNFLVPSVCLHEWVDSKCLSDGPDYIWSHLDNSELFNHPVLCEALKRLSYSL